MPSLIKRRNNHSDRLSDSIIVNYRFIRAVSLITDESINIGMVIDKSSSEYPTITLVKEIKLLNKLFPIFDLPHAHNCLEIVKTRYKLNKIKNIEMEISKTIFLSNIKTHTEYEISSNTKPIEDILYDKYMTYSKTQKTIMTLYKSHYFKDIFLKYMNIVDKDIVNKMEPAYISYSLIERTPALLNRRKKLASYYADLVE